MLNPTSTAGVAEVRAHDLVMRYRRAGTGRPVVVLRAPTDGSALWPELDESLASSFRVITPEVPATGADVTRWVGGFLEGVGLDRVMLVATDAFCVPALELALLSADQVDRLALVPAGSAGDTGLDGMLATSLAGGAVPLLVVRRGMAVREALPLLMHFMESGMDGGGAVPG
jgi:pimeloyl-ACP methyl ester carboxylesterase